MNILTKICVVVLLVSSLVACVVFVNMATNVPNYRYYYEQELEKSEKHEAKIRAQMHSVTQSRKASEIKDKESSGQRGAFLKKIDTLQAGLKKAELEIGELERKSTGQQASVAALTRANEAQVKTINGLHKDLTAARDKAHKKDAAAINYETLLKKTA